MFFWCFFLGGRGCGGGGGGDGGGWRECVRTAICIYDILSSIALIYEWTYLNNPPKIVPSMIRRLGRKRNRRVIFMNIEIISHYLFWKNVRNNSLQNSNKKQIAALSYRNSSIFYLKVSRQNKNFISVPPPPFPHPTQL